MATILTKFLRSTSSGKQRKVVCLTQGKLHPDPFFKEQGVADKLLLKALANMFPGSTGRIGEDRAATTSREFRTMYDRQRKRLDIVE